MALTNDEYIEKISHNIESLSTDVYKIRKTFEENEKLQKKLSKKDRKRRESLKKAQKKFKNISTNLNIELYKKFEKRISELKMTKSAYITKLILKDLNFLKTTDES